MDGGRERRMVHGVSWGEFERRLARKGDRRRPLLAYLDGTLEIMSPSDDHEWINAQIGRLLEVYAEERSIEISVLGSWTLRSKLSAVGVEPDNCYVFGPWRGRKRPDLAIEVVWTRGGIAKLEIYRRLRVPEVWFWRRGEIQMFRLGRAGYVRAARSSFTPDIDLALLCQFIDRRSTSVAKAEYRAALRRLPGTSPKR